MHLRHINRFSNTMSPIDSYVGPSRVPFVWSMTNQLAPPSYPHLQRDTLFPPTKIVGQSRLNITTEVPHHLEFTIRDPYRSIRTKDKVNTTFDKLVSVDLSAPFWGQYGLYSNSSSPTVPCSLKGYLAIHLTRSHIHRVDLHSH